MNGRNGGAKPSRYRIRSSPVYLGPVQIMLAGTNRKIEYLGSQVKTYRKLARKLVGVSATWASRGG